MSNSFGSHIAFFSGSSKCFLERLRLKKGSSNNNNTAKIRDVRLWNQRSPVGAKYPTKKGHDKSFSSSFNGSLFQLEKCIESSRRCRSFWRRRRISGGFPWFLIHCVTVISDLIMRNRRFFCEILLYHQRNKNLSKETFFIVQLYICGSFMNHL